MSDYQQVSNVLVNVSPGFLTRPKHARLHTSNGLNTVNLHGFLRLHRAALSHASTAPHGTIFRGEVDVTALHFSYVFLLISLRLLFRFGHTASIASLASTEASIRHSYITGVRNKMIAWYRTWSYFLTRSTHSDCKLLDIGWSLGSCMGNCSLNS